MKANQKGMLPIKTALVMPVILIIMLVGVGVFNQNKFEEVQEETIAVVDEEIQIADVATMRQAQIISRSNDTREEIPEASQSLILPIEQEKVVVAEDKEGYISIDEVTISVGMDLTQRCGLTRNDFIKLMTDCRADTSGFFEENAGLIYDLCEKYELNEIFFCGLISAESGWNIAGNHRRTHNYISLMSSSGLIYFDSVESGLEGAAKTLHNNYLTQGGRFYYGKTLEAMRTRFCPVNPGWTSLVYGRMQQIVK
jgi:hypothetical protein